MAEDRFWREPTDPLKVEITEEEKQKLKEMSHLEWEGGPTIGGFLRQRREEIGRSQGHVAARICHLGRAVRQPDVSRWEGGSRVPPANALWYLFTALELRAFERLCALELLARESK